MKKKTIANMVMILAIILILAAGVLGVGHIQGWFDQPDEESVLLTDYRGVITLERDGVAYTTTEDTIMRPEDQITCNPGATVKITVGDGYVVLGQNAKVMILDPSVSGFSMEVHSGEVFVNAVTGILISFDGKSTELIDTVAALSVRKGAQSINVYCGSAEGAQSGETVEWIGEEMAIRECSIESLNQFNIAQIRKVGELRNLCFSIAELDALEEKRQEEIEKNNQSENSQITAENSADESSDASISAVTDESEASNGSQFENEENSAEGPNQEETSAGEQDSQNQSEETTGSEETVEGSTESSSEPISSQPEESVPPVEESQVPETTLSCTITIRCDTILDNWDSLDPAKAPYVPESGCILQTVTAEFTEGETVFDVLNRVCSAYGIQLEYSWTPMYDSYYIEGINNLYEFDCGYESGWMYKVDGWFPNYGCSSYTLTGGENIVWCYTCVGLGADVGKGSW